MSIIRTIAAKEFKGYFKSYTAYIVAFVYLLLSFAATFYAAHFFEYDNRALASFFAYQPEILNVLLPALTMKMWAEESRLGTLEFVLTQPVKISVFVWGKFWAAVMFALCMLLMTIPFTVYTSFLVDFDMLNLLSAYLGWILAAVALCAVGCLVSACNGNVIVAYISSVFVGWLLENISLDVIFSPLKMVFPFAMRDLNDLLNFGANYQAFAQGQPSLTAAAYFIFTAWFALVLNQYAVAVRRK